MQLEPSGGHGELVVSCTVVPPSSCRPAIVEKGQAIGFHLHATVEAGRDPEQRPLWHAVAGYTPPDRLSLHRGCTGDHEEVGDGHPARAGVPGGLEHIRPRQVATLIGYLDRRGTEVEEARGSIQHRAEDTRRIRPREAEPLHRTLRRNQRTDLA